MALQLYTSVADLLLQDTSTAAFITSSQSSVRQIATSSASSLSGLTAMLPQTKIHPRSTNGSSNPNTEKLIHSASKFLEWLFSMLMNLTPSNVIVLIVFVLGIFGMVTSFSILHRQFSQKPLTGTGINSSEHLATNLSGDSPHEHKELVHAPGTNGSSVAQTSNMTSRLFRGQQFHYIGKQKEFVIYAGGVESSTDGHAAGCAFILLPVLVDKSRWTPYVEISFHLEDEYFKETNIGSIEIIAQLRAALAALLFQKRNKENLSLVLMTDSYSVCEAFLGNDISWRRETGDSRQPRLDDSRSTERPSIDTQRDLTSKIRLQKTMGGWKKIRCQKIEKTMNQRVRDLAKEAIKLRPDALRANNTLEGLFNVGNWKFNFDPIVAAELKAFKDVTL
jgi:hypothetical protein